MKPKTVSEYKNRLRREFIKLSPSYRAKLARDAKGFMFRYPGSADNDGFWRGLSARQVVETNKRMSCKQNHSGNHTLTLTVRGMWECQGCGTFFTDEQIIG